jgi:AcrR family transcriptional regulator
MPRRGLDTEQVVDAAIELADEEGLARATLVHVAGRLGVRPPSLYNHVDGRAALIRLITLRGLDGLAAQIATAAAGLSGADALRATCHAYRDFALANPGCYEAMIAPPKQGDAELLAATDRVLELLAQVLRAWSFDEVQTIDAIRTIRGALHGFVTLQRAGGFGLARRIDDSFECLVETLVAGIGAIAREG